MKIKTPKDRTIYRLFDACRTASRRPKKVRKGIDYCDITYESMYALMETQQWKCAETNIPFVIMDKQYKLDERNALGINSLNLPSIDRINNTRGYTMDNIRIVTNGYNNLKNIHSDMDVWQWINSIKSDNNGKSN
jgi:hypothetical protein